MSPQVECTLAIASVIISYIFAQYIIDYSQYSKHFLHSPPEILIEIGKCFVMGFYFEPLRVPKGPREF